MKEEFVEFLTAYPNSSDGASAYAEYVLARKDATASELLRAARRYAHNTRFAKADCLPESGRWLQERRWHNDIRTTPDEPKLLAEVLAIGRIALGLERAAPEAEE